MPCTIYEFRIARIAQVSPLFTVLLIQRQSQSICLDRTAHEEVVQNGRERSCRLDQSGQHCNDSIVYLCRRASFYCKKVVQDRL